MADVEQRFNLSPTDNDIFFQEWQQGLPQLTAQERENLDQIQRRFLRHRKRSSLAVGAINQLLISPLLTLAGLYDEPFYVTTEASVELEVKEKDENLRGPIDTLVIAQQLWVLIVESKSTIAFSVALPQLMTYMMANPYPERPVYGMIGNGDEFMFIKMLTEVNPQYDLSNIYYRLLPRRNQLYDVLSILKQIAKVMVTNIEG
ncbi:MAG: type I restriction endonuclease subunit R [Trichodesmium sp. St18_bin1]|nr:type I restriction endonuclease subunit R [Trichodesmium sp. St18_bin1]